MPKPLTIIGIDPGTTTGYAIVSLSGSIIKVGSCKNMGLNELVRVLVSNCRPIIVGTDKAKVPALVRDVASKFNCIIVSSSEDLKKDEKKLLVSGSYNNDHESDALACALFAYKQKRRSLKKIFDFVDHHKVERRSQFIVRALRERSSFASILENLTKREVVVADEIKEPSQRNTSRLVKKVSSLKNEVTLLQKRVESFKEKVKELRKKSNVVKRSPLDKSLANKESTILSKDKLLKSQKRRNQKLSLQRKKLWEFIAKSTSKDAVVVKKFSTLGKGFNIVNKIVDVQVGDVILVVNTSVFSHEIVESLANLSVTVLSFQNTNSLIRKKFRYGVIRKKDIESENEFFCLIKRDVLEKRIVRRVDLDKVVDDHKNRLY